MHLMDIVLNNKTIIHGLFIKLESVLPCKYDLNLCLSTSHKLKLVVVTRNGIFFYIHYISSIEKIENPGFKWNLRDRDCFCAFTSDVDRDRSVPVALRVPGKSLHRNTPMTACRTQRRSAPSVRNATLIATPIYGRNKKKSSFVFFAFNDSTATRNEMKKILHYSIP